MIKLLSVEDKSQSINDISDEIEDDFKFGIIDYEDQEDVDYKFIPMLFMESFNMAVIELSVGGRKIKIPADWSIIIGDGESGDLEILEVKKMADRDFNAFVFNPITGFYPKFLPIEITNIYPDIKWYMPKLKLGHILVVPIEDGFCPECIFIVKETNKLPDILDLSQLV